MRRPGRVMTGAAALAVCAGLLAACASGPGPEVAQRAQTQMIGTPKSTLLACAGVPARQAFADGNEYYTYVARPTGYGGGPSSSIGIGGGSGGVGVGLGLGIPLFGGGGGGSGCEATFTLSNDLVRRITYPAGADLSSCGAIVQNCVGPS